MPGSHRPVVGTRDMVVVEDNRREGVVVHTHILAWVRPEVAGTLVVEGHTPEVVAGAQEAVRKTAVGYTLGHAKACQGSHGAAHTDMAEGHLAAGHSHVEVEVRNLGTVADLGTPEPAMLAVESSARPQMARHLGRGRGPGRAAPSPACGRATCRLSGRSPGRTKRTSCPCGKARTLSRSGPSSTTPSPGGPLAAAPPHCASRCNSRD